MKSVLEQIKAGAEFTYLGHKARFVGHRTDQTKIAIEYNVDKSSGWCLASVGEGDDDLQLVKQKISLFVNIYKNADGSYRGYVHNYADDARAGADTRPGIPAIHAVKIAHNIVVEI